MITKINENDLKKLVTEVVRDVLSESLTEISYYDELYEACSPKHFKEVKYFSPDGRKNIPNGHPIQKGGFISACKANLNNFILSESVHDSQYGLSEYRGGVIVFSTEVNAVKLDKKMSDETIGAYSIDNAFKGKYVGDNGEEYNERSMSIEINGLSSKALLYLGEMIARAFHKETVLIKDLNKNKIYLANGLRQNNPLDLDSINCKSN